MVTPPESVASPSRVISAWPLFTWTGLSPDSGACVPGTGCADAAGGSGPVGQTHSLVPAGAIAPVVASKAMIRRKITGVGQSIMPEPRPSPLHDNERQRRSAATQTGTLDR